jgi:hypothetical protein
MKKLLAVSLLGAALALGSATAVYANTNFVYTCWQTGFAFNEGIERGNFAYMRGNRGMMWDNNGNRLTREAFEQRVDSWIASGYITSAQRDHMLTMYDWRADGFGCCVGGIGGIGRGSMRGFGF